MYMTKYQYYHFQYQIWNTCTPVKHFRGSKLCRSKAVAFFSCLQACTLVLATKVFTVYPCLHHLPMPSPSTHAFSVYSCLHHLPMPSPSTYAFSIYPCLLHLFMPSPSTHAFSVYSCCHHLPMPSPSTHAFTIYPCFLCPPMPSLSTHAFSCPFEYFFSEESKRRGITVVIDSRDGSWSNLVTVLGCLKVSNLFVF